MEQLPQEKTGRSWSALALEGTVVSVEPQHGVDYPNADPAHRGNEEAGAQVVAFDDPRAHERVVEVTVEPEWTTGADEDVVITLGAGEKEFVDGVDTVEEFREAAGE